MEKDFDKWNSIKKQLDQAKPEFHIKERQIWWCSLGINIGSEQNEKNENFERPVLVLKVISSEIILIIPFTSKLHENRHHAIVTNNSGGKFSVILSQLKVISSKRFLRQVGWIKEEDFCAVYKNLMEYIKCPSKTESPPLGRDSSGPEGNCKSIINDPQDLAN